MTIDFSQLFMTILIGALGFTIAHILNGIKTEIHEIKKSVTSLENDIRDRIDALNVRVAKVETRCELEHG